MTKKRRFFCFLFAALTLLLPLSQALAAPGYFEPWGKDADLIAQKSPLPTPKANREFIHRTAEHIISFRQKVISPVDGPRSHFRPTSSRYMQLAIRRYGFIKGYLMGCDRLLRENREKWVYETRVFGDKRYKWNPAVLPFPH